MPAQNAEGIILRKSLLRETSLVLVLFTREFGKIRGVIKGVRNPFPQFGGDYEIFTRCKVLFYRKKKKAIDLITQCEAVETFFPVRKDIERLTYASYFIELVNTVTCDYDENPALYDILTGSLKMLATESSPRRVSRIFEMKVLASVGIRPELERCVICGSETEEPEIFSVKNGGIVCKGCGSKNVRGLKISKGAANFLKKIQLSEFSRTFRFKVSRDVGKEVEVILREFLLFHVGDRIKSLGFLEKIKKQGIC